jgi:hypothetical protein
MISKITLLSLLFCLFTTNIFADELHNHGYIGRAQFNISEERFSLFKNSQCKYNFNDIHFHPRDFIMQGESLEKIYDESEKNCVNKILTSSLPLLEHWGAGNSKRPVYYSDDKSKFYWNTISDIPTFEEYRQLPALKKSKFVFLVNGFLHFDRGAIDAVNTTIKLYKDLPIVGFGEIFGEHDIMSDQMNPPSSIDLPGLDKIYELAGKKKWFVMIHNNLSHRSFKGFSEPVYREGIEKVLKRHPNTLFVWAHGGIMRNIMVDNLTEILDEMLRKNKNLYIDLSFVILENYIMPNGQVEQKWIKLIEKHPSRFLFGSDDLGGYKQFYDVKKYIPLLDLLKPETAKKLAGGNFDYLVSRALNSNDAINKR